MNGLLILKLAPRDGNSLAKGTCPEEFEGG
jgi:hypothetical protein